MGPGGGNSATWIPVLFFDGRCKNYVLNFNTQTFTVETFNTGGTWSVSRSYTPPTTPSDNAITPLKLKDSLRGLAYPPEEAEVVSHPDYAASNGGPGSAVLTVDLGEPHMIHAANLYLTKDYAVSGEVETQVLIGSTPDMSRAKLCQEKAVPKQPRLFCRHIRQVFFDLFRFLSRRTSNSPPSSRATASP